MTIVAQTPPIRAVESPLLLIVRRLLRGTMDVVAQLGTAQDRRALAVAADQLHDASLARSLYVAALGAREAEARGCGCATRFDRVIALGLDAQKADAVEDGHYDGAFVHVGEGQQVARSVAARAERLIDGRSA